MTYALQIFTAFLGAFGFSVLFNIRRTKLWIASVGGALAWSIYLALGTVLTGDAVRYFFAAAFVTVYAEIGCLSEKQQYIPYSWLWQSPRELWLFLL